MRGNCFESQQIWWSEIRADDGGGGVIRIRVEGGGWGGVGESRRWWWWLVGGGGCGGTVCIKGSFGRGGSICTHSVNVCVHLTVCVCVCRSWIFSLPAMKEGN